jgi:hypothetical protein
MMMVVGLLALLATGSAYAGPHISDDFSAQVQLKEWKGNQKAEFNGKLDESYSEKKLFVTAHNGNGDFTFLRLFNQKIEYIVIDDKTCHHRAVNGTMYPAFEWAKDAERSKHACYRNGQEGEEGVLFMREGKYNGEEIMGSICVDKMDETKPFWTDFKVEKKDEGRTVYFHQFSPKINGVFPPSPPVWPSSLTPPYFYLFKSQTRTCSTCPRSASERQVQTCRVPRSIQCSEPQQGVFTYVRGRPIAMPVPVRNRQCRVFEPLFHKPATNPRTCDLRAWHVT